MGFTPALYAKLAPHLTVFSGRVASRSGVRFSQVLDAMGMDGADVVARRRAVESRVRTAAADAAGRGLARGRQQRHV